MNNLPKERKFIECFKSNKDGSCNYCKTRSWRTGNKVYAMKKDGKWLACTDRKCYLEQGGKLTLFRSIIPELKKNPTVNNIPTWIISRDAYGMILQTLASHNISYSTLGEIAKDLHNQVHESEDIEEND